MVYYTQRIKEMRKYKDLRQTDVAEKMGIKREQYRRYENGINEMPLSRFIKLCQVLDVSADYLCGLSDEMKPVPKR